MARHEYWMRYRPPGYATVPQGFTAFLSADTEHQFGGVVYDRPLAREDIERFQLIPADPRHPINLKADFERFHSDFMGAMATNGETYRVGTDYLVAPSTVPGVSWQLTHFIDDVPTGHEDFDDFDELARRVWGLEWQRNRGAVTSPASDRKHELEVCMPTTIAIEDMTIGEHVFHVPTGVVGRIAAVNDGILTVDINAMPDDRRQCRDDFRHHPFAECAPAFDNRLYFLVTLTFESDMGEPGGDPVYGFTSHYVTAANQDAAKAIAQSLREDSVYDGLKGNLCQITVSPAPDFGGNLGSPSPCAYLVTDHWTHIGPNQVERDYRFVYDLGAGKILRLDEIRNVGAPVEASREEYSDVESSVVQNLELSDADTLGLVFADDLPEWAQHSAPYTSPFSGPVIGR